VNSSSDEGKLEYQEKPRFKESDLCNNNTKRYARMIDYEEGHERMTGGGES
jgi:hypothetical protein